jgi:hypothetical protein
VVLGLFLFWGWDTAVNLNEESKDGSKTPGRAVIISMFFLDFIFVLNIVAAQMLLPEKELANQGANLLFYFSQRVGGQAFGYLMIFAVLISTFSEIDRKTQTPLIGTLIIATLTLLGIISAHRLSHRQRRLRSIINDIGVLVAVYYGATGIACAWAYRTVMFTSAGFFVSAILLPFLAGLFCFWVGYEVVRQSGLAASVDVLVVLVLGISLVWGPQRFTRGDFLKATTGRVCLHRVTRARLAA